MQIKTFKRLACSPDGGLRNPGAVASMPRIPLLFIRATCYLLQNDKESLVDG